MYGTDSNLIHDINYNRVGKSFLFKKLFFYILAGLLASAIPSNIFGIIFGSVSVLIGACALVLTDYYTLQSLLSNNFLTYNQIQYYKKVFSHPYLIALGSLGSVSFIFIIDLIIDSNVFINSNIPLIIINNSYYICGAILMFILLFQIYNLTDDIQKKLNRFLIKKFLFYILIGVLASTIPFIFFGLLLGHISILSGAFAVALADYYKLKILLKDDTSLDQVNYLTTVFNHSALMILRNLFIIVIIYIILFLGYLYAFR